MQSIHILNGDCILEQLQRASVKGDYIVCRECLVEGPVAADSPDNFWKQRAEYISKSYGVTEDEYLNRTASELRQLTQLPEFSNLYLWFEDDLFCQVNLWFILSLLSNQKNISVRRIFPVTINEKDKWKGFGVATSEMLDAALQSAVLLSDADIRLGKNLWEAYTKQDFIALKSFAATKSAGFHELEKVVAAHVERFTVDDDDGRPEKTIRKIMEEGVTSFQEVFAEFSKREGIYGFSDLHVMRIFTNYNKNKN